MGFGFKAICTFRRRRVPKSRFVVHLPPEPKLTEAPPWPTLGANQRFDILSDSHLERFYSKDQENYDVTKATAAGFPFDSNGSPYCLLLGDIAYLRYDAALKRLLAPLFKTYKRIFWVLGNHEFYGLTFAEGIERAKRIAETLCKEFGPRRFVLLHRETVIFKEERLLLCGCTLWTDTSVRSDEDNILGWNIKAQQDVHKAEFDFLFNAISDAPADYEIIIATHHCPVWRPEHPRSPRSSGWYSDTLQRLQSCPGIERVKLAVFGHTHDNTSFDFNGIYLRSNQMMAAKGWKFVRNAGF